MTARSDLVEVICDGPGTSECPDSAAWSDYGTAAALRERMRADGWETGLRGGVDRCPTCKTARRGHLQRVLRPSDSTSPRS